MFHKQAVEEYRLWEHHTLSKAIRQDTFSGFIICDAVERP